MGANPLLSKETIKNFPNNNRFYVLVFAFLLSVFVVCLLRMQVEDDGLYYIRLAQAFGFLAVGFLYATLIITPLKKIIGTPEWMKNVVFARRAIGAAVLYFALLHAGTSLWGQIGGFDGLALLPDRFVWPLIFGVVALGMLGVLAVTSLDKMVILLTYPGWKWVQRLVYVCGIIIIMHVWAIGAHFAELSIIQTTAFIALAVLFGLEAWRIVAFLGGRYRPWHTNRHVFFVLVWLASLAFLVAVVLFSRPASAHMFSKDMSTNSGAVLHITPDDDPIAGESALFAFDLESAPSPAAQTFAKLTITDDQNHVVQVPAQLQGNIVKAEYTFPRQGLYKISLMLEQDGKPTHHFTQSQRVSRGIITNTAVSSTPLWAGAGVLSTVVAAGVVAIIAFNRRHAINTYSKL